MVKVSGKHFPDGLAVETAINQSSSFYEVKSSTSKMYNLFIFFYNLTLELSRTKIYKFSQRYLNARNKGLTNDEFLFIYFTRIIRISEKHCKAEKLLYKIINWSFWPTLVVLILLAKFYDGILREIVAG